MPGGANRVVVAGFRGVAAEALSPDGRRKVTIGFGDILLRDAATLQVVLTLPTPANMGNELHVAFSDDGLHLTVTWTDGAATWDASPAGHP